MKEDFIFLYFFHYLFVFFPTPPAFFCFTLTLHLFFTLFISTQQISYFHFEPGIQMNFQSFPSGCCICLLYKYHSIMCN